MTAEVVASGWNSLFVWYEPVWYELATGSDTLTISMFPAFSKPGAQAATALAKSTAF